MPLAARKRSVRITAARTLDCAAVAEPEQAPPTRSPSASSPATSGRSRARSAWSRTAIPRATGSSPSSSRAPARRGSSASPGPPGVGKSTLIGAICTELRKADREIGVLSIDPSSPFTQGAVLGDRIRLSDHFLDPGVFIRSMATRGSLGGLAEAALQAALLMDASGKDDVLLETVGVGPGRDRRRRSRRHDRARADAGLRRLDPGAEGGRDGDPRRDLRQQGRPPARQHDDPRGQVGARARARARLEGAGGADRGVEGRGDRRAAARRSTPTASRSPRRAPWPSAGLATCAPRCSGSPPRGCAASSSSAPRRDPRWAELLDRVVRREIDPATAARELVETRAG